MIITSTARRRRDDFPNIEKKALELGLDEISVLKHHSRRMPNGEAVWVCWKRVKPDEWQRYLDEYAAYRPEKLTIHSGVESELCGEDGEINISDEEAAKIDMVALSVHYMPDLDGLKMDFLLYPDLNFCPEQNNEEGRRELARWREKAAAFGAENAVKGLVNGYCNAIRAHKKVRTLSHMYDGCCRCGRTPSTSTRWARSAASSCLSRCSPSCATTRCAGS